MFFFLSYVYISNSYANEECVCNVFFVFFEFELLSFTI